MCKLITSLVFIFATSFTACANDSTKNETTKNTVANLKLPAGFTATLFATNAGRARHIAVNTNGDVYVKLERLKDGKGILRLRDTNGDGIADETISFGNFGGTGIAISNGYLYASSDNDVFRYKFNSANEIENPDAPEQIVTGLLNKRQHASKSITLDGKGNIYVNIGAPSNACQETDRTAGSPGQTPCPILETAGGIWQFRVDKLNQSYADGIRYATGLRNVVGLDWNFLANDLYVTMHGRDQMNQLHPTKFTPEQSAELPAEEFFLVKKGMDFGWPYCYYDPVQKKKVLGPEYGGDGIIEGQCNTKEKPLYAFPAHWGPNALLFYTGEKFGEKYKNGAFIAFHGSWNKSPLKQGGYNIVFLPMKDGKPSGDYEIFADNFAGGDEKLNPASADHRPCGLAMDSNGALYISDDKGGAIFKVSYTGSK